MSVCPKCGQRTTIWSRDLGSGHCKSCQQADAVERTREQQERAREQEEQARMQQEEAEKVMVDGKTIECPICGHGRFGKQETLMSTRGATFMNMDWMNAGALTCICKRCGHVLWFRR